MFFFVCRIIEIHLLMLFWLLYFKQNFCYVSKKNGKMILFFKKRRWNSFLQHNHRHIVDLKLGEEEEEDYFLLREP